MREKYVYLLFLLIFVAMFCWNCNNNETETTKKEYPKGDYEVEHQWYAKGSRGMVVGTSGAQAVRAGLELLKQGGSAVDAVLTTALGQISLSAGAWMSYAGIMTMVYYDAETEKVYSMGACYKTVQEEIDPLTIPRSGPSGRMVLVPGFMAGVQAAHKLFGKLPFKQIFDPAINIAENGFYLYPSLANTINQEWGILSRLPETKKIFAKDNGHPYTTGELFTQPDLAKTLKQVASKGAEYMYTGEWGQKFVSAVRNEGGKITLKDMKDYRVVWSEPVHTTHNGYDIYALGLPSSGGVGIIEAFNLMEWANFERFDHYTALAEPLYWFIKIARVGIFFSIFPNAPDIVHLFIPEDNFSPQSRLTRETAKLIWDKIYNKEWNQIEIEIMQGGYGRSNHSGAVLAVDESGNVAAIVHSINTSNWGTTGIFVDGVSIPDSAYFQQARIEKIGPGNHLPDPTNPCLVLENNIPVLASGCIGSGLHNETLQNLYNVIYFNFNPKTSLEKVKFLSPDWNYMLKQKIKEYSFPEDILNAVIEMGQDLTIVPSSSQYWAGIKIDSENERIFGAVSNLMSSVYCHAEGY